MTHPAMFAGLLVIMTAYLALVVHLMGYLRRVHPQTWVALERPEMTLPAGGTTANRCKPSFRIPTPR